MSIQAILVFSLVILASSQDYQEIVQKIEDAVQTKYKNEAYNTLAYIVDTYGPRMWGSVSENVAMADFYSIQAKVGFDNLYLDKLEEYNTWARGEEFLILHSPRTVPFKLDIIGLGLSVPGDVKGEVVVVRSFDELEQIDVQGKIVCFNQPWNGYDGSAQYRVRGPSKAAAKGAKAVLVRSVASFSISSPHTGSVHYDESQPKIPAVAITIEDAEMFQRMQDRGQIIEVHLHLESKWYKSQSHNLIAEIVGSEKPDEIVLMGGHFDSWDTGSQTGANDDGGGFMVCFEALKVLHELGLRPKRTIRAIAWSGEEMGQLDKGAWQYEWKHGHEKHVVGFESDEGTRKVKTFGFTGNQRVKEIVNDLTKQYLGYQLGDDGEMVDTTPLYEKHGVPMMRNMVEENETYDFYFTYHHSAGDSMSIMDSDDLDDNVRAIAQLMYLIADSDQELL